MSYTIPLNRQNRQQLHPRFKSCYNFYSLPLQAILNLYIGSIYTQGLEGFTTFVSHLYEPCWTFEQVAITSKFQELLQILHPIHAYTDLLLLGTLGSQPQSLIKKTIEHYQSAMTLKVRWNNPPRRTKVFYFSRHYAWIT